MKKTLNLLKYPSYIFLFYLITFKILPRMEMAIMLAIIFAVSFPYILVPYLFHAQARQSILYKGNFFVSLILCLVVIFFLFINQDLHLIGSKWYNWSALIDPTACLLYLYYITVYSITYFIAKQKSITKES